MKWQSLTSVIDLTKRWRIPAVVALLALASCAIQPHDGKPLAKEYNEPRREIVPVHYPPGAPIISSEYASHVNATGQTRTYIHNGLDLGKFGDDVLAMADGIVTRASGNEWGNTIMLYHGRDEDGLRFYTSYGHLHAFHVKKGDRVKRGQVIATVGGSGKAAGIIPHLHMMTLKYTDNRNDSVINRSPHRFWWDGPGLVTCFDPAKDYGTSLVAEQREEVPSRIRFTYPIRCK
jgi:murein DD-endopeptidase MepM/ murein hydrolase activator NlpD